MANYLPSPLQTGAALLQSAGQQASDIQAQKQKKLALMGTQFGALGDAAASIPAAMAAKRKEEVVIDEGLAKELARNTGNQGWMDAVGTRKDRKIVEAVLSSSSKIYGYNEGTKRTIAGLNDKEFKVQSGDQQVTYRHSYTLDDASGQIIDQGLVEVGRGNKSPAGSSSRGLRDMTVTELNKTMSNLLKEKESSYKVEDEQKVQGKIDLYQAELDKRQLSGPDKQPVQKKKYATAEEVKADYKAGNIKQKEAIKILEDDFGIK